MSDYRVDAVRVFSTDSCAALAFYRDTLGWPLRYDDEQLGWAQFDLSSCDIGPERMDADEPEAAALVGRFVGVSIEVPDIQDTFRCWQRHGVELVEPPVLQPWGGILAHFKDVDGNTLSPLQSPN